MKLARCLVFLTMTALPAIASEQETIQTRLITTEFKFAKLKAFGLGEKHPEMKMCIIELDALNDFSNIRTDDYKKMFEQKKMMLQVDLKILEASGLGKDHPSVMILSRQLNVLEKLHKPDAYKTLELDDLSTSYTEKNKENNETFELEKMMLQQELKKLEDSGLGKAHPSVLNLSKQFNVLEKLQKPDALNKLEMNDISNIRTEKNKEIFKLEKMMLQQELKKLEDSGLGKAHPSVLKISNQLTALEKLLE